MVNILARVGRLTGRVMEESKRTLKIRLILIGLLVILGSIAASLAATHISFIVQAEANYRDAMIAATIIPLCVAPLAYGYCAWLNMKLVNANEDLRHIARQDGLTGLLNRRAFMELSETEPISAGSHMLVMADIDHFKAINDTMGHAAGDVALQHIAHILVQEAPSGTLVARLGGEEFALLVPAADLWANNPADTRQSGLLPIASPSSARQWAAIEAEIECIRVRLAALPVITPAGVARITASFGLAVAREQDSLDTLLSRADKALYAAKNAGRNRLIRAAG